VRTTREGRPYGLDRPYLSLVTPLLLLTLGLLLVASVGGFAWYRQKQRRELLQGFAASEGWTFAPRDDSWTARFPGKPFGTGDHRRATNVLQGAFRGRQLVAFDYSFQTHSSDANGGSSTTTHRYAFCALGLPTSVPRLELLPEGRLGRVGTALGRQDIELESEDFNRRYRVQSDQPKFAYDVLAPRTMEALLTRPALHLRLQGADAVCWENGQHSPVDLLARLDALCVLLDGIPPYVWSDLRGATP
jgi:hypothetical protein